MFHDSLKEWVRVEVLEIADEADEIYLKLIDFGTEEWVEQKFDESQKFKCLPDEVPKLQRSFFFGRKGLVTNLLKGVGGSVKNL